MLPSILDLAIACFTAKRRGFSTEFQIPDVRRVVDQPGEARRCTFSSFVSDIFAFLALFSIIFFLRPSSSSKLGIRTDYVCQLTCAMSTFAFFESCLFIFGGDLLLPYFQGFKVSPFGAGFGWEA